MKRHIQAVVFDLGGTLIEYAGPYQTWPELETPGLQAAHAFLLNQGIVLPDFAQFRDTAFAILPGRWREATEGTRNLRLVDHIAELLEKLRVAEVPTDWISEAARAYQAAVCSQAKMISGAPHTLALLKEQGYKLALLSNTMFEGSAHIADLQRFDLDRYFDAMLFSADENKWKPSPPPYLHLLERLQVAPANAVFIGDSPHHDVAGGREAGMHTIYFRSSDRFEQPEGVCPDATIFGLRQVPGLLAGWNGTG